MPLKTWLFALVLFLMMAISGVVHSEEVIGIYGKPVQDGTTVDGIYYGNGYKADSPNLLIGGILQNSQDPDQNDQNYRTFADNNQAIYVPTYYAGNPSGSLQDQLNAIGLDCLEVNDAAQSIKTPMNGLSSPALNDKQYDTIIGYSGGTTTVVTAIAKQKVTAKTLILISPMCGGAENAAKLYLGATGLSGTPGNGFDWQGEFAQKIQKILASGTKIVVIQSPVDTLPYNEKLGSNYQYRFPTDTSSAITVYNINLETKGSTPIEQGINAHIDIFSTYAMNHITNGVYVNPQNPWNSNVNQPYVPKTSTPQRSESSIVGKWNFQYQDLFYHNTTLDFYVDGTFIFPGSGAYGKWTQDGNSINMHFDSGWASHPNTAGMLKTSEGIFTMEGEGPGWNWYAEKVGAYPDPRGFPGQEEPGLF